MTSHSLTVGARVTIPGFDYPEPGEIIAVLNYGHLATVQWPDGETATYKAAWLQKAEP